MGAAIGEIMDDWNSIDDVLDEIKRDKDDYEHVMIIGITRGAGLTVISGDRERPKNMVEANIRAALFCASFEKIKIKMLGDDPQVVH